MAKRKNKIDLRLNDAELAKLNRDVEQSGWSREKYLRALIENRTIKAKPPKELVVMLKELQQIGNNMNQIARKANALNLVDASEYWKKAEELEEFKGLFLEVMYG